jgi:hypothetical protein
LLVVDWGCGESKRTSHSPGKGARRSLEISREGVEQSSEVGFLLESPELRNLGKTIALDSATEPEFLDCPLYLPGRNVKVGSSAIRV